MTEQQFLRQIKRLLHCKADKKREILRQLESDIASAKEGGKSWEEIRQEWGTPEQFVSEFNEDGRGIQKGKRILIGSAAVIVLFACVAAGIWFAHAHKKTAGNSWQRMLKLRKSRKFLTLYERQLPIFRMMHMKNLSLGVMRKCRRHFLRKIGKMHKKYLHHR